jgi:uncharacterized membrane protein YraQ (UPF0718 family)
MDKIILAIGGILGESWSIFREAAIYLVFGFIVAGLIRYFVPGDKIAQHLGGKGLRQVVYASVLGVPLPLCSCGVMPAAIGLHKQGASKGATLSFLVSTPETGVDSIVITYALLDPIMTIFRPVAAFLTAMWVGISENILGKNIPETEIPNGVSGMDERNKPAALAINILPFHVKLYKAFRYAFISLLGDLANWLILGFVLAGAISYLIPVGWLEQNLHNHLFSMLIMLVIGIPLYVCATASTPIAAALMLKGLNPGAALVFLLAGPATNIASMVIITKYFGKKSLVVYLSGISICALFFGFLLDGIYSLMKINPIFLVGKAGELMPAWLEWLGVFLILGFLPFGWYNEHKTALKKWFN